MQGVENREIDGEIARPLGLEQDSGDGSGLAKALPIPPRPTQKEIEEYEISHLPFRTWCEACVKGRARSQHHRQVAKVHAQELGQDSQHHLSVDYLSFGDDGESYPGLTIYHRNSKSVWAHCVEKKGKDEFASKSILGALGKIGCKRAVIKSDQEAAIKALAQEIWDRVVL